MSNLNGNAELSDLEETSSLFSRTSSDIDSPSDGYFSQRQHPQQTFVQNPSTAQEGDAKVRDVALQERNGSRASPTSNVPSPVWATEQTPLLDGGPAPPDYHTATAHRLDATRDHRSTESSHAASSYGSVADQEYTQHEQQDGVQLSYGHDGPFASGRPPQSMSNPSIQQDRIFVYRHIDPEHQAHNTRTRKAPRRRSVLATCCTIMAAIFAGLVVVIVVGTLLVRKVGVGRDPQHPPHTPSNGTSPPDRSFPPHKNSPGCTFTTFTTEYTFDFESVSNFSFIEKMHTTHSHSLSIGGNIWVQSAPETQKSDIRISLSFATNAALSVVDPRITKTDDGLILDLPELANRARRFGFFSGSCIDVGVVIQVKEGARIEDWTTAATHLNIRTQEGLFDRTATGPEPWLAISNSTEFRTVSGALDVAYWSSRTIVIETVSGSITGEYALRDLLSIKSQSGSLNIDVNPKKADPDKPAPAIFKASTKSGSVRTLFPLYDNDLPDRDYETYVQASSGTVSGDYILGSVTKLRSISGSITADVLPFDTDNEQVAIFDTDTRTGSTNLDVLSPYNGGKLANLHSKHTSRLGSGSLHLRYPSEWQGKFSGETTTGSLRVHGRDVEIDFYGDISYIGKRISGHKDPSDGSKIEFATTSGSVDLQIGDD